MSEAWLKHQVIQAILNRLIDYLDRTPIAERSRPPGFRISADTIPELFTPLAPGEDSYVWGLIKKLEELDWVRLKIGRVRPGIAEYEGQPYLSFNIEKEREVRALLERTEPFVSYTERWRDALTKVDRCFPGSIGRFARQPIRIPGREPEEIVAQLSNLPRLEASGLYLREVSAQLFWGLSKILDSREEAIAELFGVPVCPFAERPVIVHTHIESTPNGILFIENETAYATACRQGYSTRHSLALVFASGFKSTALRLRAPDGSTVYFSEQSIAVARAASWFLSCLRGEQETDVFFWGDLDFAGMSILKLLRELFPRTRAWRQGYQPMLEILQDGGGHTSLEAAKQGQKDPGRTGCKYADTELLPKMREAGRFVDQEITALLSTPYT